MPFTSSRVLFTEILKPFLMKDWSLIFVRSTICHAQTVLKKKKSHSDGSPRSMADKGSISMSLLSRTEHSTNLPRGLPVELTLRFCQFSHDRR
mmetsp:Transcript_541/g.1028  ORF Transcript_541/g.1028 Transcript_541/m.1028 type:complete len:93 (+) Transcript_541:572-850(+)